MMLTVTGPFEAVGALPVNESAPLSPLVTDAVDAEEPLQAASKKITITRESTSAGVLASFFIFPLLS
jgi:hypothetical protein